MRLACVALACGVVLTGCGAGADRDGPVQGYLLLQRPDGTQAEFGLGRNKSLAACGRMLAFELNAADEDNNGEFWTNPTFDYGGHKQRGWERNVVLGGRCEYESPR